MACYLLYYLQGTGYSSAEGLLKEGGECRPRKDTEGEDTRAGKVVLLDQLKDETAAFRSGGVM